MVARIVNGKADMDCIRQESLTYIRQWQLRRLLTTKQSVTFGSLKPGDKFTLPGGRRVQTKLGPVSAQAGNVTVSYEAWEKVVRLRDAREAVPV